MHRLLILSRFAQDYQALIESAHLHDLAIISSSDPAETAPQATPFDLAFGEPALLRQVMPSLTGVRWMQSTWAGVEPLLDPALRRDYVLTNARGVFGPQMSEYVFGYLLAHERRIFERQAAQAAGVWDQTPPARLRGKQIGLLGVGTIGAALASTAKHFGMRVKGYTRASEGSADVDEYFHGPLADCAAALGSDLDYLVSVMPDMPCVTARARSTNKSTAVPTSNDRTRQACSSAIPRPSLLVARILTVVDCASTASTRSATASRTCSQLSNSSSRTLSSSAAATDSMMVLPGCWVVLS